VEAEVFVETIKTNPANRAILERLPALGLKDVWLVSGSLFQTVWNVQTDRSVGYGIKDYDIFYFDPDTSWEAEDKIIRRCAEIFADLSVEIEARNQARVHLWYKQKFGSDYTPLGSSCEGIDRFLAIACKVGLSPQEEGAPAIYAPNGLEDVADMIVRPNPSDNYTAELYLAKAKRWQARWPELRVLPA